MGRRKTRAPLDVVINNRLVGRLVKEANGAIRYRYDQSWLDWEHSFAISLSLPLRETAYTGAPVTAVFDNLLPDDPNVRKRVAERVGAQSTDYYSLLESIGRDCVGAMQFLPDGKLPGTVPDVKGEPLSEDEIERILANLEQAPLGIEPDQEFRISVAGAQEKTALLFHEGRWMRPLGTTPTTHILKPQLGQIPTAFGMIDMKASVDNEHYCLELMRALGFEVARSQILTFGKRRVLAVERFDRIWRDGSHLLRLPQEDFCQATGTPSALKYQNNGGPGIVDGLKLLQSADEPLKDQAAFFKAQITNWLIGATDGHGKNFSIFLRPEGRYGLTPFYDVLSAQPALDERQIPRNRFKLAMSVGNSRKYEIIKIVGRHFIETGKEAGLGQTIIRQVVSDLLEEAVQASEAAIAGMPADFAGEIHDSVSAAMAARLRILEATGL
ncbi:type II toxin-antitoxin system HipA family toxin [Aureimonas altamirensis]|uniref:type II toxin-antitoxin system HipA family toxin n=1 Tax=Aureimonas altamirensis TaxID=370622 RepID=UPI0020369344|nr:type II toxin-antitoxin system HipA family toxin [Aureimonas altamirensis]MCM2503991.1 type II toxin-antitoxin system HipA family toxin [Aureimonas altamirensis]